MDSSVHRLTDPSRSLLQHSLPSGSQPPSGTSTCSSVGYSTGCRLISAPPWTSMGWRGTACRTWSSPCCREISALAPGRPPSPSSSLTLVSAALFLSHCLTPLSGCNCPCAAFFFQLLKYVITEALPLSTYHWHWLCQTQGKLLAASHRTLPSSPPTTKTSPHKPNTASWGTGIYSLMSPPAAGYLQHHCG